MKKYLCYFLLIRFFLFFAEGKEDEAARLEQNWEVFQERRSYYGKECIKMKVVEIRRNASATDINDIFRDLEDNSRVIFQPGEYDISETLLLCRKKNIILDGSGAVLVVRNDIEQASRFSSECLHIENCKNISLLNFHVRTQQRSNTIGFVQKIMPEYVDIRFDPRCKMTGKEQFIMSCVISEEGHSVPIWAFRAKQNEAKRPSFLAEEIPTTGPELVNVRHEKIADNLIRVYTPSVNPYLKQGMRCKISHSFTGLAAFTFRDSEKIMADGIVISDWGGMGFVILPRCRDFTFKNLKFLIFDPVIQACSSIHDAIHTTGLGGKLLIENCRFEGVGDDIVNVHTPVLTVKAVRNNTLDLFFDKLTPLFPKRWGKSGDSLYLYDGKSLQRKAELRIKSVKENIITLTPDHSKTQIEKGDYVINKEYCPEIIIRDCEMLFCRSRFCIQAASKMDFYNNRLISRSAVPLYISAAFRTWGEGGFVRDISIYENEIVKLEEPLLPSEFANPRAIWIRINENDPAAIKLRYRNIRIFHNKITGIVDVTHVDGLEISDNIFNNFSEDVIIINKSTDIIVSNNSKNPETDH